MTFHLTRGCEDGNAMTVPGLFVTIGRLQYLSSGTQLSKKARLDANVRPIKLPKRNVRVRPGMVCSVAGWGQFRMDSSSGAEKLHEVELEIQKDEQCMSHYHHLYNPATQMCVGNPRRKKSALQVRSPVLSMPSPGTAAL